MRSKRRKECIEAAVVYVNPSVMAYAVPAPRPGSLWVQYKLSVQCRTPSRSDRFNGVTGGAGGPKGRNRNLPWPPCKKGYIVTLFSFVYVNPSVHSLTLMSTSPFRAGLIRVLPINIPPHSGGYFSFGHSPNNTSGAQVRIKCLPACVHYLLPVNGSRGSNILNWSASLSLFS